MPVLENQDGKWGIKKETIVIVIPLSMLTSVTKEKDISSEIISYFKFITF